jgi:arylsulfatase A-like enzyme
MKGIPMLSKLMRCTLTGLMWFWLMSSGAPSYSQRQTAATPRRINVLFIAVDDLRPELGAYGVARVKTPNIDRLAARGLVFERAYCQQALCSPSRTSLMTGLRPDTTRIYDLNTHFRYNVPDAVTLPQYFKQHGYYTASVGKVYHGGLDDPLSWSAPSWVPPLQEFSGEQVVPGMEFATPENQAHLRREWEKDKAAGKLLKVQPVVTDPQTGIATKIAYPRYITGPTVEESPNEAEDLLPDGAIAKQAVATLNEVKDKTFFLAVGFRKPHLPFVAPKKYFDVYSPAEQMPLVSNPFPPQDAPKIALSEMGELRAYTDMPRVGTPSDAQARQMIRGYLAATSYADAMIGRVLDELDRLKLADNTIIVLWGDHGYQLGEHGQWCKHNNFEVSARSPLIVSVPGQKTAGQKTSALVEFVDIYPTIAELAGLPAPANVEGFSAAPLLSEPQRKWKQAAFSQYPRVGGVMGYSMKTERYRYTEWIDVSSTVLACELYDHKEDPQENINVAARPEHKRLIEDLSLQLRLGWRAALPKGAAPAMQKIPANSFRKGGR